MTLSPLPPQLPPLREELELLPGPPLADGQPSWTLHDPSRNQFFQIDWPSMEMLSRWPLGSPEALLASTEQETTLRLDGTDLLNLLGFLQQNELLHIPPGMASALQARLQQRKGGWGRWLLHNYLFFRIPLWRPDAWLNRMVGRVDFLYTRQFLNLTLFAGLLGIAGIHRQWEHYSATLIDMLSWNGMLAYGITLGSVKFLHELGHAFTAKRYGCRVPTMGLAFLVLWPVAYTDTNEVWKLNKRQQRLLVAGAGMLTELLVAIWASLAWVMLPDGSLRNAAFLLSSTTWISTLLINASPFMRFDGYFLLSDFLQLPNLHSRAFALARWDLRERLFGLGDPPPEHFRPTLHRGLVLFAWSTWIYRLLLFLGIAALVYHFFIKAIGIGLFMVEIGWFVLLPFWHEFQAWRQRQVRLRGNPRARRALFLALLLVSLGLLPLPLRIQTTALLQPQEQLLIYAQAHAQLVALPLGNQARVEAGQPLLLSHSPDLDAQAAQNTARSQSLDLQAGNAPFDAEQRRNWNVLQQQLSTVEAGSTTVAADNALHAPRASFAGVLHNLDPDLQPGDWLTHRELLGRLVGSGPLQVVTYVDEEDIHRIAIGDRAVFIAEGHDGPSLRLEVASIDKDASRSLGEPELASQFGGHVQVREKNGVLYPERAQYRVVLKLTDEACTVCRQHSWRGQLSIAGQWEAPGLRLVRNALSVVWREAGF